MHRLPGTAAVVAAATAAVVAGADMAAAVVDSTAAVVGFTVAAAVFTVAAAVSMPWVARRAWAGADSTRGAAASTRRPLTAAAG